MNSVSELYSNSPHSKPFYPLRFAAKPEAGARPQKKKAGLPVIRQPGCPLFPSGTRGFPPTDCSVFGFC